MTLQQPVVIAVSSCFVKRYIVTEELQLSSTPASHCYLNPNVPETMQIMDVYNELLGPAPLLAIQPASVQNLEEGELGNRVSLKTLLDTNPEIQQGARFTVEARLARIDTTNRWYYNKCDACGRHMDGDHPHWQCHEYGTQPIPNYNYCFEVILKDATGTIIATLLQSIN